MDKMICLPCQDAPGMLHGSSVEAVGWPGGPPGGPGELTNSPGEFGDRSRIKFKDFN